MPRPLLVVWLLLAMVGALALDPRSGPASAHAAQILAAAAWGVVVTLGGRTGLFLRAARDGQVPVTETGRVWRMWHLTVTALPAALVSGAIVAALVFAVRFIAPNWVFLLGIPAGTALVLHGTARVFAADVTTPRKPRRTTLWRWILLDTALPAALVTAPVSAGFAYLRLYAERVPPVALSRHLALTLTLYGVCLGMVGFFKTYTEKQAGLVVVAPPLPSAPGPFALAAIAAVAVLILGPRALPSVTGDVVVALKAAFGFFGGGLCAALGGLKGANASASS